MTPTIAKDAKPPSRIQLIVHNVDAPTVAYNVCYAIGLWRPDGMMSLLYNLHTTFFLLLLANSPDGCLLCNCELKCWKYCQCFHIDIILSMRMDTAKRNYTICKDVLAQGHCNRSGGKFSIHVPVFFSASAVLSYIHGK